MSSILPNYEYDIFISYRQKDNKADQWVTHFVDALKDELDATFKEDISIYFDENPHDGLLETHDVDQSLKEKIKALVFIPIISQTYCDPNSFAWQHEFIAFRDFARQDKLGTEIKLTNGNVVKRILPIRIHEISEEDTNLYEAEVEGVLRSIDFIYKEPGVNRPLKPKEIHPDNNLTGTIYHDQINKVANAIKDIINALKNPSESDDIVVNGLDENSKPINLSNKKRKRIVGYLSLATVLILLFAVIFSTDLFQPKPSTDPSQVSIGIIPFRNNTGDKELNHYGVGIASEVRTQLALTKQFDFISSLQATIGYQNKNDEPSDIGNELGVTHIVSGMYQTAGNDMQVFVELVEASTGKIVWSLPYKTKYDNLFALQEEIANKVMEKFVVKNIEREVPTQNMDAYASYAKGLEISSSNIGYYERAEAIPFFERSIQLDSGFLEAWNEAFLEMSHYYFLHDENDTLYTYEKIKSYYDYIMESLPDSWQKNEIKGIYEYYVNNDYQAGLQHFLDALDENPLSLTSIQLSGAIYRRTMQLEKSMETRRKAAKMNPQSINVWNELYHLYKYNGDYNNARKALMKVYELNNEVTYNQFYVGVMTNSLNDLPKRVKEKYGKTYDIYLLYQQENYQGIKNFLDTVTLDSTFNIFSLHFHKSLYYYNLKVDDSAKYYAKNYINEVNSNPELEMLYENNWLVKTLMYAIQGNKNELEKYYQYEVIEDDLYSQWSRMRYELFALSMYDYEAANDLLQKMNKEFPHLGHYGWLNFFSFNRIRQEYPPFQETINNLQLPPKLGQFDKIKM